MMIVSPETECSERLGQATDTLKCTECPETQDYDLRRVADAAMPVLSYREEFAVYSFPLQAAGHPHIFFKLEPEARELYKAMFDAEFSFNCALAGLSEQPWPDPQLSQGLDAELLKIDLERVAQFVPRITGKLHQLCTEDSFLKSVRFAALADITHGLAKPCIMDIKLGRSSVVPTHSAERQEKARQKDLIYTTATLGFRIQGLRRYDSEQNSWILLKKDWVTPSTDPQKARELLRRFLPQDCASASKISGAFADALGVMLDAMTQQRSFSFAGVSLMLVYDGSQPKANTVQAKLIDFAEVSPFARGALGAELPDNGLVHGLAQIHHHYRSFAT